MIRKSDLSLRIGMIMLVLCATLLLTVLPAAAYYNADKPLVTYDQGTVTGGMTYTIGNSSYSSPLWNYNYLTLTNDSQTVGLTPDFPDDAQTHEAVLYVHWTWSYNDSNSASSMYDTGVAPTLNVTFVDNNGVEQYLTTPDRSYVDWKDDTAGNTVYYNYPSGTYAYNVTDFVEAGSDVTYVANVKNNKIWINDPNTTGDDRESVNIQAVGLLTLYDKTGGSNKHYWINEGCDVLNNAYDNATDTWKYSAPSTGALTPDDCVALANFSNVDTTGMNSAKLITCVPSGSTPYNRLYVNYFFNHSLWQNIKYWDGLWNASPYSDFSWTTTDVYDNLIDDKTNYVGFQDGLYSMIKLNIPYKQQEGQMEAANAFLLLENNTT